MAGSSTDNGPTHPPPAAGPAHPPPAVGPGNALPAASFYFDLASPEAYLAAERALQVLPGVEWIPVLAADLGGADSWQAFRCAEEREIALARIERAAAARGLQPVRWPDPFPFDARFAMHVATYAKQIGRTVAFALAAFRQAYAGGRSLAEPDNVVIAASACEMHPAAVTKAAGLRGVREALAVATALAARRGVRDVPAVWVGDGTVFHGDADLERAGRALGA